MRTTAESPFVRQLTLADLPAMVALREAVNAKVPAGFLRSKTESEIRAYLDGTHGVAYGIVEGSALLAVSLLRVPDENHPNAGLPFPLVPEEEWSLWACFSRTRWFYLQPGVVDITESYLTLDSVMQPRQR